MMVLLTAAALTGETRRREQQDESVCSNKWSHTHAHAHTPTHTRAHTHTHTHLHTHTYTHLHTHTPTHAHTYTHTRTHTHTHTYARAHAPTHTHTHTVFGMNGSAPSCSLLTQQACCRTQIPPGVYRQSRAGLGRAGPGRAGPGLLLTITLTASLILGQQVEDGTYQQGEWQR